MGVFKKLKDIFYDEEIIEEEKPVIKEVREEKRPTFKREEPIVTKKEQPKNEEIEIITHEEKPKTHEVEKTVSERELFQSKQTFKFPVLDDEDDYKPETPKLQRTRSGTNNIMDIERKNKEIRKVEVQKKEEKPKVFKPSPIISPVYGILDKDFDKEEVIKQSKRTSSVASTNAQIDYDRVRRKAYGLPSNEVEDIVKAVDPNKTLAEVEQIATELEKIEPIASKSNIESLLEEIEVNTTTKSEKSESTKIEEVKENSRLDKYKETPQSNKKLEDIGDKTLEHDLFNLIDSMYEEEE